MDRKEFIDLCYKCSFLPKGVMGIHRRIPDEYKVIFDGILYYPQGYQIQFNDDGRAIHIAILHDLKANSVVKCSLESVRSLTETKRMEGDV